MLKAVKFIPRDQLNEAERELDLDSFKKHKKKHKQRSRHHYDSSDEDKEIKKKKRKRWDKWSSSGGSSESENENYHQKHKPRHRNKEVSKKKSTKSSEEPFLSAEGEPSRESIELVRKEMGLEWMLKPLDRPRLQNLTQDASSEPLEEEASDLKPKSNPKELNPYLKDGGDGYPEDGERVPKKHEASGLPHPSVVGDGGASWRLKALRRAQEQAAREGRKLDEVVEERWGSLGQMAASVATLRAAPAHAHLRAIRDRKHEQKGEHENIKNENNDSQTERDDQRISDNKGRYLNGVTIRDSCMKAPKLHDSLSWRSGKKGHGVRPDDAELIRTAASSLNKYTNDGSFFEKFGKQKTEKHEISSTSAEFGKGGGLVINSQSVSAKDEQYLSDGSKQQHIGGKVNIATADHSVNAQNLSANQLAARAMQLRLKGKNAEADELLKESQKVADAEKVAGGTSIREADGTGFDLKILRAQSKLRSEENADAHLASKIMNNKQYKTATQADDEYDFGMSDIRESNKKKNISKQQIINNSAMNLQKRILTQQERCQLCFDNPSRPKHLLISIANFTYLMLPPWEPIVQGHCYILPMQHEQSTRNLDDDVWEEFRNFKKCLLRMYAEQGKDVVFLETAMGLAQQRRHCLVECIPLPQDIAKEAPLYFKKAIDEAEEEWSQHNAKKLIDTSIKGLRGSIPKNFPYFHVEFGLKKGFVHVIDDEKNFKSHFGLNVIRGMLQIQEEDMYRRRKQDSFEMQKKAVSDFSRKWEPFDWTKMLD